MSTVAIGNSGKTLAIKAQEMRPDDTTHTISAYNGLMSGHRQTQEQTKRIS